MGGGPGAGWGCLVTRCRLEPQWTDSRGNPFSQEGFRAAEKESLIKVMTIIQIRWNIFVYPVLCQILEAQGNTKGAFPHYRADILVREID